MASKHEISISIINCDDGRFNKMQEQNLSIVVFLSGNNYNVVPEDSSS